MNTLEAIRTRRSIRRYTDEKISPDKIRILLEAAMVAPSDMDQRPWQFVVIEGRSRLTGLADVMEHCDMLREATLGILVCGDLDREQLKGLWIQDCSAATQNLRLAAHEIGLGAVWIGVHVARGPFEHGERGFESTPSMGGAGGGRPEWN